MSKGLKILFSLLILLVFGIFLTNTSRYMTSLSNGLSIWATSVLPALLPFILLTKLFVSLDAFSGFFYKGKVFPKVLNSPKSGSYVLLLSMLCGYPIGAKIVSEQFENRLLTKTQAMKLATFTSTAGPVYLIGTVGIKMLNSVTAGLLILICHFVANFLNGIMYRKEFIDKTVCLKTNLKNENQNGFLSSAMLDSVNSVLCVGGFIAIFYMLCDMIFDLLPSFFVTDGQIFTAYFLGLLEMTNGCLLLSQSTDIFTATILCCGLVSFGGLCVLLQCMSFLGKCGIKTKTIVAFKLSHSALATIVCFVFANIFRLFGWF